MVEVTLIISALAILVLLVVPILVVMRWLGRGKKAFCADCGHEGRAGSTVRGSLALEIVFWLLFIIPGLIYSIWRTSTRRPACSRCGSERLVPPDSPLARKLRTELAAPQA